MGRLEFLGWRGIVSNVIDSAPRIKNQLGRNVDVFSTQKRSQIMAAIKGKDTSPEWLVRSALHRLGLRFRLHDGALPGRPDLVFRRSRVAVFIHGCFWHQHSCKRGTRPSTRRAFWNRKLAGNVERDTRVRRQLRAMGWRTIVVWECQTRSDARLVAACRRVLAAIESPLRAAVRRGIAHR